MLNKRRAFQVLIRQPGHSGSSVCIGVSLCSSPPSEIVLDPIGELSTRFHGHFSDFATKRFTAEAEVFAWRSASASAVKLLVTKSLKCPWNLVGASLCQNIQEETGAKIFLHIISKYFSRLEMYAIFRLFPLFWQDQSRITWRWTSSGHLCCGRWAYCERLHHDEQPVNFEKGCTAKKKGRSRLKIQWTVCFARPNSDTSLRIDHKEPLSIHNWKSLIKLNIGLIRMRGGIVIGRESSEITRSGK